LKIIKGLEEFKEQEMFYLLDLVRNGLQIESLTYFFDNFKLPIVKENALVEICKTVKCCSQIKEFRLSIFFNNQ